MPEISVFAWLSLIEAICCLTIGVSILNRDTNAYLNRIFCILATVVSLDAFIEFQYRIADSAPSALAWMQGWIIWPMPFAITMHFIVRFIIDSPGMIKRFYYLLIYGPAALFIVCGAIPSFFWVGPILQPWGWTFGLPSNPTFTILGFLWASGIGVTSLGLIFWRLQKPMEHQRKQQAKYVMLAIFVPLVLNIVTGGIPRILGVPIPEMYNTWFLAWCAFIGVAMVRFELFAVTPLRVVSQILALMLEAFVLVDARNIIQAINPAAIEMFGMTSREVLGRPFLFILGEGRINVPEVAGERLDLLLQPASIRNLEVTILNQKGKEIPLSISKSQLLDKGGHVQGAIFLLADLSELKREETARFNERERVTKEFLTKFSHELRTPLNAIIGFSEILVDQILGPLNPSQLDAERDVLDSAQYLLALINEVLDISKLDQGEAKLDIHQFSIGELLEEITPRVTQINTGKGCAIVYDIEDSTMQVRSSKKKLAQALVTLMAKAIQSTPPSKRVTLSIRKTPENEVSFSITDEGQGFKEDDKLAILQNLGKGDVTEGKQLGLNITRNIIEILGGSLQLTSTLDQGATFTIRLPLEADGMAPIPRG